MTSQKTAVLEYLYSIKPVGDILNDDIVDAIRATKVRLSTNNPANFLKDIVRKPTANSNWPTALCESRITARQLYGNKKVFEFISYEAGQTVPFPDSIDVTNAVEHTISTLTIPTMVRKYGSGDENWIAGLVHQLGIVEAQLGIFSLDKWAIEDATMLQIGKKTQPEIDMLYVARYATDLSVVSCEIKAFGERILLDQIEAQVSQALSISKDFTHVIPMAIQPIRDISGSAAIHVVEFRKIARGEETALEVSSQTIYRLSPPIIGLL